MKVTPSNCKLDYCAFNRLSPGENNQECIGCQFLKDQDWMPEREKGEE